jgi:hypothetical protein
MDCFITVTFDNYLRYGSYLKGGTNILQATYSWMRKKFLIFSYELPYLPASGYHLAAVSLVSPFPASFPGFVPQSALIQSHDFT